ncbi:hypothetical protein Taro_036121 [Colocasia esculenta]|uniref:Uncharacterized protein n=1 Tax=Colocasia esculenta TaxID=4460 RepID=A0A843W5V2_COLES|nr:hypothetical protein [Colocasia esculenta]
MFCYRSSDAYQSGRCVSTACRVVAAPLGGVFLSRDGEALLWRSGRGAADGSWRSVGAASWSEEDVAVHREGPSWVRFFVKGRHYLNSSRSGRIGSSSCFLASLDSFPCSPPPCVHTCMVCGRPGMDHFVLGALRHQKRHRPGQARPYRGTFGCRDKARCRSAFVCRDVLPRRDRAVAARLPIATGFLSRRAALVQQCLLWQCPTPLQ